MSTETEVPEEINDSEDKTYWNWRALAGYVYLTICIFDFIAMPIVLQFNRYETNEDLIWVVEEHGIDKALEVMDRMSRTRHWTPITLVGGGLFHISFGAILTGVAVSHGNNRRATFSNNNRQL